MRNSILLAGAVAIACLVHVTPATACGGCFSMTATQNPTVVTDHRMILSVSPQQTTLYDQIRYTGSPDSFAWVLPIAGTAEVGLSADVVFGALDTMTSTKIYAPPRNCAPPPYCKNADGGADASASADASFGGVDVLKSEVVGPYETVQLASTDPNALESWLTSHGYDIPADIQPVIDAYVQGGFDFLAMKLVPGATVQSMRPVRVTTQGASPVLPLRMVAAGTGTSVGITLWVIGDGRYEPQNFPSFRIEDSEIVWDYSTQSSNYAGLRQFYEQQSGNRAWELESALPLNVGTLTNLVDYGGYPYQQYNYDAGSDYDPVGDPDGGDGGMTSAQVRDADLATLFAGISPANVHVTRIRADLGRSALADDLVLQASPDQSMLTNLRYPPKSINAPACPSYPPCSSGDGLVSGGGCAVAEGNDGNGFALLLGGLGIVAAHSLARRRKR